MSILQKRIVSVVAAAGLMLNAAIPVLAQTIVISGNGAGSDNFATVSQTTTTVVSQTNNANVTNKVTSESDSGHNEANFNTGGSATISTGDASSDVNVSNSLNSNTASVDCCQATGTDVTIEGNGAFSNNIVDLDQSTTVTVSQDNTAKVHNDVYAKANSGGNEASLNTGGDTTIMTGKASTDVNVSTQANGNIALVGAGSSPSLPSASFIISGNGAGSQNYITADLNKSLVVNQENTAKVHNDVDAKADSGHNDAKFNTGGDVLISTGDADASVDVDNMVNFNHADVDCGCTWDVLAKIEGNGADPEGEHGEDLNSIKLDLDSVLVYAQDNNANLRNDVYAKAKSGHNEASLNTGDPEGDPTVLTGDASDSTTVENSGNVNSIGDVSPIWPWWPSDWDWSNVSVSFDLSAFLAFFGLSL